MSKEAVAQFLAKLSEDPKLQDQLVQFAAQHGFEFTTDELSDADLENLSGGLMPTRRRSGDGITLSPQDT